MHQELTYNQKLEQVEAIAQKITKSILTPLCIRHHARDHYGYQIGTSGDEIRIRTNFQTKDIVNQELEAINIQKTLIENLIQEIDDEVDQLKGMFYRIEDNIRLVAKLSKPRLCNHAILYNKEVVGQWRLVECEYAMIVLKPNEQNTRYSILSFFPLLPRIYLSHKIIIYTFKEIEFEETVEQYHRARRVQKILIKHRTTLESRIEGRIKQRKEKLIEQCTKKVLALIHKQKH